MRQQSSILDLLNRPQYPYEPGFQKTDTSYDAAVDMIPKKDRLQQLVMDALADHGAATSHELAMLTGESYASIQPRTAELRIDRKIEDSGTRRKTPSGKNSIVWKLKSNRNPQE